MELSVSSETTFFTMKLRLKICPQLRTQSSAEDRGRIDTSSRPAMYPLIVLRKYQYFGTTRWLKQCCVPPRPLQSTSYEHFHCLPNS